MRIGSHQSGPKRFFPKVMSQINSKEQLRVSTMSQLTPFIDRDGMVRVSGRLNDVIASYQESHQTLFQTKGFFL